MIVSGDSICRNVPYLIFMSAHVTLHVIFIIFPTQIVEPGCLGGPWTWSASHQVPWLCAEQAWPQWAPRVNASTDFFESGMGSNLDLGVAFDVFVCFVSLIWCPGDSGALSLAEWSHEVRTLQNNSHNHTTAATRTAAATTTATATTTMTRRKRQTKQKHIETKLGNMMKNAQQQLQEARAKHSKIQSKKLISNSKTLQMPRNKV